MTIEIVAYLVAGLVVAAVLGRAMTRAARG
jgi:hypothetical protein